MYNEHIGKSLEEVYKENKKLIYLIVNRMYKASDNAIGKEDIEGIAIIGFIKGYETYSKDKNIKLSSWLMLMMKYEILISVRNDKKGIKISRLSYECHSELKKNNMEVTESIKNKWSPKIIKEALELDYISICSYDIPAPNEDEGKNTNWIDNIEDNKGEEALRCVEYSDLFSTLFKYLSDFDKELLRLRQEEGLSTTEIAKKVGMSQGNVSKRIIRVTEAFRKYVDTGDVKFLERMYTRGRKSINTSRPVKQPKKLREMVYAQTFSIKEISEVTGYSPDYVVKYKRSHGKYRLTKKQQVIKLLEEGNNTVREIAEIVNCAETYVHTLNKQLRESKLVGIA